MAPILTIYHALRPLPLVTIPTWYTPGSYHSSRPTPLSLITAPILTTCKAPTLNTSHAPGSYHLSQPPPLALVTAPTLTTCQAPTHTTRHDRHLYHSSQPPPITLLTTLAHTLDLTPLTSAWLPLDSHAAETHETTLWPRGLIILISSAQILRCVYQCTNILCLYLTFSL